MRRARASRDADIFRGVLGKTRRRGSTRQDGHQEKACEGTKLNREHQWVRRDHWCRKRGCGGEGWSEPLGELGTSLSARGALREPSSSHIHPLAAFAPVCPWVAERSAEHSLCCRCQPLIPCEGSRPRPVSSLSCSTSSCFSFPQPQSMYPSDSLAPLFSLPQLSLSS